MKLALLLALQTLMWNHRQWHAEEKLWQCSRPFYTYQDIQGPAKWLIPRLTYDPQMKLWEVEQGIPGTAAAGWTPVYDGNELILEDTGYIRIVWRAGFSAYPYRDSEGKLLIGYGSPAGKLTHVTEAQAEELFNTE
jgi:hypothetical protein